jgi:hypothetical protein
VLDAILTQLATTAGTTIAAAMATDTWQAARAGIVKLFSHRGPAEQAAIEAQLDRHNAQVERADDPAEVRRMMSARWNSELEGMLMESPDLAGDLQTLVTSIQEALPQQGQAVVQHTVQNVTVGGYSNITPVVMNGNVYYDSNATPPPAV